MRKYLRTKMTATKMSSAGTRYGRKKIREVINIAQFYHGNEFGAFELALKNKFGPQCLVSRVSGQLKNSLIIPCTVTALTGPWNLIGGGNTAEAFYDQFFLPQHCSAPDDGPAALPAEIGPGGRGVPVDTSWTRPLLLHWSDTGWQTDSSKRSPVLRNVGTETSVQRDPGGMGFIEVNSEGFGASTIVMRGARNLEGPWSPPKMIYRPPESDAPDAFVYAGKSHAELKGADLILTYVASGPDEKVANDTSLYFPRFVKVELHIGEPAH